MSLNADIGSDSFVDVLSHVDKRGEQENLTLILNSNGGSIEFAFLMAKAIREKCDNLTVLVPLRAKSAATLLALAADEILFGRFGELGPLDPQVPDLAGGSGLRSPLEIMKGLEFLRNYYIETFDVMVLFLLQRAGMDVAHTFEHVAGILSPIAGPLYQMVNYRELGEASRHLEVSQQYAKETMYRWSPLDRESADDVVDALVWRYPDHGYIIDLEEARSIGLSNVEQMTVQLESLCYDVVSGQDVPVMSAAFREDPDYFDDDDDAAKGKDDEDEHEPGCS